MNGEVMITCTKRLKAEEEKHLKASLEMLSKSMEPEISKSRIEFLIAGAELHLELAEKHRETIKRIEEFNRTL